MTGENGGRVTAILVAAGASSRMGFSKLTADICGQTPLEMSLARLLSPESGVDDVVIAVSEHTRGLALALADANPGRVRVVDGGASRAESVYNALKLARGSGIVAVHDAARCLVPCRVIRACVESAAKCGSGVAALRVRDTVRGVDDRDVDRDGLRLMQTPQAFSYAKLRRAYDTAEADGTLASATDDCALYIAAGGSPAYVEGGIENQKLTYPEDMEFFIAMTGRDMRFGIGEDTHRLTEGRALVLGGVDIPCEKGLLGHSDADVLVHAVMDAILGACALGDIGKHFPDTDEKYRGISSIALLRCVGALIGELGYRVSNIDTTVAAQRPKLAPHITAMRENIANALGVDVSRVSVKATTTEGMNDEGAWLCISARAVCCVVK